MSRSQSQSLVPRRVPQVYTVQDGPEFYTVRHNAGGETHRVRVDRRRRVGACSCGAAASIERMCWHQAQVTRFLLDRWWAGVERRLARKKKSRP